MKIFDDKEFFLTWCSDQAEQNNYIALEFGVYTGYSLSILAKNYKGLVYGFDSFEGLPEFWRDGYPEGHFKTTNIPEVKGAQIIVGLFQETLESFLSSIKTKISLIHFDADLYSSTSFCLQKVKKYLNNESIFVFDEYHNYPGWEDHEHKAFIEWLNKNKDVSATKIAEVKDDEQVAFRITINK